MVKSIIRYSFEKGHRSSEARCHPKSEASRNLKMPGCRLRTGSRLRSFLRFPRPRESCAFVDRSDDLHRVPIVRQFFAALQANHIGAGEARRTAAAGAVTRGDGKTVMRMPTAEDRIEQLCEHTTSQAALLSAIDGSRRKVFLSSKTETRPSGRQEGAPLGRSAASRSAPTATNNPCGIAVLT